MNYHSFIIFLIFANYGSFFRSLSNDDFKCPFCIDKLSSSYHLISHINDKHTENEITICPECYQEFQYGSVLEVHMYINHVEKKKLQSVIEQEESDLLHAIQLHLYLNEENERNYEDSIFNNDRYLDSPTIENIVRYIRPLSENSPGVLNVYLSSPIDYYKSAREDIAYGCVYRSLQMMLSSVMLNADYNNHIIKVWENLYNISISRSRMPKVSFLEMHLEESWNKGINPWGKKIMYERSQYPTKNGSHMLDVDAMLTGMRIRAEYIHFEGGFFRNTWQKVLKWLYNYFQNKYNLDYISPVMLHYPQIEKIGF
ncbi:zinc finger-containing ubiquitin peptidase 1-like isoform X2 [Daktulosphaira vitifoliae]|uniref:zinc finger-containing ubiquitin peptidase 1-like isoform X2 n=1 Tax=Daktulosphaira vitifoliae TaxID=58002 RepID=UPI0021A9F544|nr:zinc finger-containing ubiquitin peptidase 1-like isoform X2 [Daktulosphaira vitifoliae]